MNVQPSKYQVWSSVLGANIATLLPDGTPLTRSIFAGKAVIAELRGIGTESYDSVTWKTSDPVTGTVVSYTNDGTSNTGIVSNQTEPLGQSISLSPPPVEPQPPTYEAHLFDAYDPEWQCSVDWNFYGGFNGLPDHCQNKILKNLGLALKDIFGWHPSSVSKIGWDSQPGIEGSHRGDNYAMGLALGSTKKTFSLGSGDGQEKKRHSIGEFVVNVSDIPDFIDASVGDPLPLPGDYRQEVLNSVETILTGNSACAEWFGVKETRLAALKAFGDQLKNAPITRYESGDKGGIRQTGRDLP